MFGRFRLVGRGARVDMPAVRRNAERSASHAAASGAEAKALIALVLSQAPRWTNALPVADPRGRAANTAALPALRPAPSIGARDTAKGRAAWHISEVPR